jgi:hypothetical protein
MQHVTKLAVLLVALTNSGCATNGYQQVYSGDAPIYCNSPKDETYCDRDGAGHEDEEAQYRIQVQLPGRVQAPPPHSNSDIPNFPAGPPL